MRTIHKFRTPIVWLIVAAMILSIGAGFFSTVF